MSGALLPQLSAAECLSERLTQRSARPFLFILDPAGTAAPRYLHGPVMFGAVWMAILPPVEKRKYVPSLRRIWSLRQS
jgi:hypothetical protein